MPPHEDQSVNSGGKHIITKKLMDALKAGEKGIISTSVLKNVFSTSYSNFKRLCRTSR